MAEPIKLDVKGDAKSDRSDVFSSGDTAANFGAVNFGQQSDGTFFKVAAVVAFLAMLAGAWYIIRKGGK